MKNLYFVWLMLLFTACFRGPHFPTLSHQQATTPAHAGAEQPDAAPEAFLSANDVAAAAGSASAQANLPFSMTVSAPTLPSASSPSAAVSSKDGGQSSPTQRQIRRVVRKVLLSGRLPARTQDDPVVPKRNGMALASLIAGSSGIGLLLLALLTAIAGAATATAGQITGLMFLLAFIAGVLAVVFGGVAKGQIRNGKGTLIDRGRATAGLILGLVNLGVFVLFIFLVIVLLIAWGWSL